MKLAGAAAKDEPQDDPKVGHGRAFEPAKQGAGPPDEQELRILKRLIKARKAWRKD